MRSTLRSVGSYFAGTFTTRLFVWLDEKAGTVFFKLAKPGLMKAFEGKWTIKGCDRTQPLSALMGSPLRHPSDGAHGQDPQQPQLQQQSGLNNLSAQWTKGAASFANNLRGEPESDKRRCREATALLCGCGCQHGSQHSQDVHAFQVPWLIWLKLTCCEKYIETIR